MNAQHESDATVGDWQSPTVARLHSDGQEVSLHAMKRLVFGRGRRQLDYRDLDYRDFFRSPFLQVQKREFWVPNGIREPGEGDQINFF